jgi:hypothetical protein
VEVQLSPPLASAVPVPNHREDHLQGPKLDIAGSSGMADVRITGHSREAAERLGINAAPPFIYAHITHKPPANPTRQDGPAVLKQ